MPRDGTAAFGTVVQSVAGRDRFRVFLVIGEGMERGYPTVKVVNGTLHRLEKPKIKHLSHVRVIAHLTESEIAEFRIDYSDKKAAELVAKYDYNRENAGLMHKKIKSVLT
ncbi:MAG: hypothetical protein IJ325_06705 [Clostridia bacterium]|nr:hypothetical protein [Clostridia bacterium]